MKSNPACRRASKEDSFGFPLFLLVFIFFRGILIKKAAVPGQAAADSDKNHYDDFRDDACKYKVTVS